jgi:uncharacterized protein involved in outer membrane biogenesis
LGSLLAALTTIVVTVLAALFAVPYIVDWNDYRSAFEAQAAKIVGRPVRVAGNIDLTILPVPVLNVRGLRIADEFGKFDKPFAEVEGLNVTLALPPLLSGTIEAKSIELDQPVIRLKIDEFGEGTWQSIGPHGFDIPLPVREVILNSVEINDGTVELRNGRETAARRVHRVSGTFSAESLTGPFRFVGSATTGGEEREIKLSAGQIRGSTLRLKASLRSADGVSLYQLDGDVKGLDGPIHYVGPVAARLALDTDAKKAKTGQLAEPMPGKAVELRASSKITLEDAKLDDITLTMTQNDRPQSFTGSAFASWGDIPRLDIAVESSWFDIDQVLRADDRDVRPVPGAAIAVLPRVFEGWSFTPRQGQIKAKIQQAGLGGDVVEGLNFTASHDKNGWQIETLVARLPGDTDIDVKGTLPAGDSLGFNGDFTLNGKNLSRLLRWAAPSLGVVDAGNAQNFSLSSGMTLTPAKLAFHEAKGALGDSSFTVDLVHDYGPDSKLLLALQSDRLDLRSLYAQESEAGGEAEPVLSVPSEPAKTASDWTTQTEPARKTSLADVLRTVFKAEQSNVSLLISQLQLPDFEARDVRSAFRYEKGTFDIKELNLASTDGLRVKADGSVTGFDSKPDGALNLSIDAPSAQSVTNLARLAGLDGVSSGARQRIEALAPFRLSGNLSAIKKERLLKLTLAGNAGGSELSFTGRLSGDLNALRDAKVDVTGMIGNANGHRLIAQLAPEVTIGEDATAQAGAGVLNVSALGAIKSGLVSRIELQTPQARGRFEGEIGLLDEPSWTLKGNLDMRASQAGTALSMLRLAPGGSPVTGAIDLHAVISKDAAKYGVTDLALTIGGETIRGTAEVDMARGRPMGKIDINAASAALPKIAAYLVDWDRQDPTAQIADAATGGSGYWPNRTFALAAMQAVDGTLKLKASNMTLAEEVPLTDARLEASLSSGTLTVSRLDGRLYGGKFVASGTLKALTGRAGLDAKLSLDDADLATLTQMAGGKELAKGKADLQLSLGGEGFSPRGVLMVLSGAGELRLEKGTLHGLSPAVLKKAANTYMTQEIPEKARLTAQLDGDFRKGNLGYAAITAPIQLKDGVIHLRDAELAGEDYRAKAGVTLDLGSLRLDSEWEVAYSGKTDDGQRLPPVHLVFAGPLAGFGNLSAQISIDQFERYLSIKRLDQDMERLEKLGQPPRGAAKGQSTAPRKGSAPISSGSQPVPQPQVPNAAPSGTIPTQSVLHAPPVLLDQPGTGAPKADGPKPAEAPAAGWSAGVEAAGKTTEKPQPQQAPQAAGAQNSGNFEAQIREVLGNQQRPLGESYNGGESQYRTQSYSRGGVKVEE